MKSHYLLLVTVLLFSQNIFSQSSPVPQENRNPIHGRNIDYTHTPGNPDPVPNSSGTSGTGANIDVIYHKIYWRIHPDSPSSAAPVKYIRGSVQTNFKTIVANVSTITFDLNAVLTVDSVRFRGAKLAGGNITRSGNIVTIALGATLANNFIDSLTIYYQGVPPAINTPPGAVGYQKGVDGTAGNYVYTLSESYEDRDWWPCKADMKDKIDSMDIIVSVPWGPVAADTFWAACNGRLIDSSIVGNNRIFTFKNRYPMASYLVSVGVARFNKYYRSVNINGTVVPVTYNIFKGKASYTTILSKMDSMNLTLAAFGNKFSDYPFKNEKHGFYEFGFSGGMEHQTFSGMGTGSLTSATVLAHELMHQWFGDNVSFSTWNDLWLAEGFAAYGELALYYDLVANHPVTKYNLMTGKKSTALGETSSTWIPDASCNTSALWNSAYGSTVYDRGCMVVSMLRAICGDTKFFQALTNYQNGRRGASATTDTLKNYFNAVLGQDITPFFTDYVGGSGLGITPVGGIGNPINPVKWNTPATNKLVIQIGSQTKSATNNVTYFHGPVVVRFTDGPTRPYTNDTTIVFFDWGGGVLSYAGNGMSEPIPGNILNYTLSFTPTNAFFDDSARTMSTGSVTKDVTLTGYTWTGVTNSTWNTTTNWTGGTVVPSGAQVTVATTGSQPVLPGNITVGGLFLNAGTTLNIGNNTLIINGPVSGAGTITGSSNSNITINDIAGTLNFDQTSAATRSLNNMTLSTSSSAILGNALDVYGTIALTSATLDMAGKNLTLKSNATGTARIADLTGSTLSGATNVTVERYIPNDGRRYRLLTPTVNTSGSIKANWMEGGMNTAIGTNINLVPGYGTQLTGSLGNTNGFDKTASNASSLYLTNNGAALTYTPVTSTAGTLNAKTGYFLFVRGDRSVDMTSTAPVLPSASTTLKTTGTLVTGTQTSFTNALVGNSGFNLLTNPYPSPIDWSLVQPAFTGVTNSYTLWDPNSGTRGGFVTVNTAGVASSGLATKFIQSGQAFFVQASGVPVPSVNIQETHKSAGNNNGVFGPQLVYETFSSSLYFTDAVGTRRLADGVITVFDNSYSAGLDDYDADEINNWDENIAIDRLSHHLSIEGRPVIAAVDTLPFFMNNMKQQGYEWQFTGDNFSNPTLQATLVDNFTGIRSTLNVTGTAVVPFIVTADPLSGASNRFMVVFGPSGPLPITFSKLMAYQKNLPNGTGIQVEWTMGSETDMDKYEVERSADGRNFSRLATVTAMGNSSRPVSYGWFDANPLNSNNFYRIRSVNKAGIIKYSSIVKVAISSGKEEVKVYPNPMKGNIFSLQLNNIVKGTYTITVTNKLGQKIYTEPYEHNGGSAATNIELKFDLPIGIYDLQVTGEGVKWNSKVVKE